MKWGALRICIFYIVLSVLWITLSDKILFLFESKVSNSTLLILSSCKGYFFVLMTGLLFYRLIRVDEVRLKESEKKYRTMYEGNPLPMWIYDLTTLKFVSVNSAAVNNYGYSEEEFLQKTTLEIRPPEDIPKALDAINNIRTDTVTASEWTHVKADGTRFHVTVNSQKLIINNRPYIMVIAKDITEKVGI
jgi:PAS domain S-box-containing protein